MNNKQHFMAEAIEATGRASDFLDIVDDAIKRLVSESNRYDELGRTTTDLQAETACGDLSDDLFEASQDLKEIADPLRIYLEDYC
jgi:hypothetical protein